MTLDQLSMDVTADQLSTGGLVVALVVIAMLTTWWWIKERHEYKRILPFALSVCVGTLWAACAGGLLGGTSGALAGGANAAGGTALSSGTGAEARMVAVGQMQDLSTGGSVLVVAITAVWALYVIKITDSAAVRTKMIGGVVVGAALSLTPLVASWADTTVVSAVNAIGDLFEAGIEEIG